MSDDVQHDEVRVTRRRRAMIRIAVVGLMSAAVGVMSMPAAHAVVTPPTVTIDQALGQADPTSGSPVQFTVVFSETVTGFTAADVTLAGSAGGTLVAALSGSGANYTVSVTGMTTSGTVIASIPAGVAQNTTGEFNIISTSIDNTVTWVDLVPTVTIDQALGQADPTSGSTVEFTVVFTESVTGFAAADVNLAASTAAGTLLAAVSGSGSSYTVSVTGMTGNGTVVASIPAGAAQDADGDSNTASTSIDNTVTWVDLAPTVTINQGPSQSDPTSTSPVVFSVVFSETVTGFAPADVNLAASTAGGTLVAAVSGSGANYTVSVTGMTAGGTIVATIPANAVQDGTGNFNTASTSVDNTVTWEPPVATTTPTPGGTSAGGGLPPTGNDVSWYVMLSLALVAAGIAILVAVRRRRSVNES
jgi:hypothetical protein